MRIRTAILAFAATAILSLSSGLNSGMAGETQLASLTMRSATVGNDLLQRLGSKNYSRIAQAGCGLCSTVDCCGGASLGWKLCKANCNTGYKCMQVSTCP
jgi:hypothetical protein